MTFDKFTELIQLHVLLPMPFIDYFRQQWIVTVPPTVWCVYGPRYRNQQQFRRLALRDKEKHRQRPCRHPQLLEVKCTIFNLIEIDNHLLVYLQVDDR